VRDNLHSLGGTTVTVDPRKAAGPGYTVERLRSVIDLD
jgi:hypothetical protein